MSDPADDQRRQRALHIFARFAGLPDLAAVRQRGRHPDQATFTLDLADGREIRVTSIKILRSQAQLGEVLNVTIGSGGPAATAKEWRQAIAVLFTSAITVEEVSGEAFADTVREWLAAYADRRATTDRDGAVAAADPYLDDDGRLNVHVDGFSLWLRGRYGEAPTRAELWAALADLGFERHTVGFRRKDDRRSTKSYYRLHADRLEDPGTAP